MRFDAVVGVQLNIAMAVEILLAGGALSNFIGSLAARIQLEFNS